ncbi:MAG: glucose-6-phosphate dehydrogenase, partial [Lentisphaerota bacterium]
YVRGVTDGKDVVSYTEEKNVSPDSRIETFAAFKLRIDNWRWQGVPIYLRCGKRLGKRVSEVAVHFKKPPHFIFDPENPHHAASNVLIFSVQPEETFSLILQAKRPGPKMCVGPVSMDFCYRQRYGMDLPEAYERLLLDTMEGDQTLFIRDDIMELSWKLFTPVIQAWHNASAPEPLPLYAAGSWGPVEADPLIAQDGRQWRDLDYQSFIATCKNKCAGCRARGI